MKKICTIILAIAIAVAASAQSKTIGGRLNGFLGLGLEVEYEHYVAGENFLNIGADFLIPSGGFGLCAACVYDFTIGHAGNFDFYAGPGVALAFTFGDTKIFMPGIVGNIGTQWNLGDHFALSLDWRPGLHFVTGSDAESDTSSGFAHSLSNIGFGIKYRW